jgi:hypothetical protein
VSAVTTADDICGIPHKSCGFWVHLAQWCYHAILKRNLIVSSVSCGTTTGPNGQEYHTIDGGFHRRSRWRGTCGRMHIFLDRTTSGHLCSSHSGQVPIDDCAKRVRTEILFFAWKFATTCVVAYSPSLIQLHQLNEWPSFTPSHT